MHCDIPVRIENSVESADVLPKWPLWAKTLSLIGLFLIVFLFVDIPVQRLSNVKALLNDQKWQLPATGVFWNVTLESNDTLFVYLEVHGFEVIFYIMDGFGNRWLSQTTSGFFENWTVPMSGNYSINIDNPYIQARPSGIISVTRYMVKAEYVTEYPFRLLQPGCLIIGVILVSIGLSAHPSIRRHGQVSN